MRSAPARADVVVYGGTAAGVMAAVAAAREGASVTLLEPGRHVGGMVSGGLGRTDVERQEALIGGLALELARRLGRVYGQEVAWRWEPSAAERVLGDLLEEHGVDVRLDWRLAGCGRDGRVRALDGEDGSSVEARGLRRRDVRGRPARGGRRPVRGRAGGTLDPPRAIRRPARAAPEPAPVRRAGVTGGGRRRAAAVVRPLRRAGGPGRGGRRGPVVLLPGVPLGP